MKQLTIYFILKQKVDKKYLCMDVDCIKLLFNDMSHNIVTTKEMSIETN